MASLRFERNGKREGWRIQFYGTDKRKRSIWLGLLTKKQAEAWQTQVEHLLVSRGSGSAIRLHTALWLGDLSADYFEKLVKAGLVDAPEPEPEPAPCPALSEFCDAFIASKRTAKEATLSKFYQVKNALVRYFGADRLIDSITQADAEEWRDWLAVEGNVREGKHRRDKSKRGRTDLSDNTVRRRTGIAKQFFNRAIKAGHIQTNPFDGLACSVHANESRQRFIDQETANAAIEASPNAEWRALIALVRYGGLRSPSEPMRMRWSDVDLQNRRLRINAKKTEHHRDGGVRYCPIFPELLPYLEDLAELAKDRKAEPGDYVIANARGSEAYCRTTFTRILEKAGIEPWPKLFQNMRASRETELLATYPVKDVCSWIGNSQAVAMKHYAMVMDSVFTKAAGLEPVSGGSTGGSIDVENSPETTSEGELGSTVGGSTGGSIPDAQKRSIPCGFNEKPLVLLGLCEENQPDQGFDEWAMQDSKNSLNPKGKHRVASGAPIGAPIC